MSLRVKTLLIVGFTLASLIIVLYIISRVILMNSFAKLEEKNVIDNIRRAQDILSDDLSSMNDVAANWAAWDDTYKFIEDRNEEYIKSNLVDQTFSELKLNFILYVNSAGEIVFSKGLDINNNNKELNVPVGLLEHIKPNDPLLSHPDTKSSLKGIIHLPEGPMLVSSRPIVTSDYRGPIRGTLIMGAFLDDTVVEQFADKLHLAITIETVRSLPNSGFSVLSEGKPYDVKPLSEDLIAGYALINDIFGEPAILLGVELPRDIYKQGKAVTVYFILSVLLVGLVFCSVTLLLLEKTVLSRLARLSASVEKIGLSGELSSRISMPGGDELSVLAGSINGMLEDLELSQQKLRKSEERFRLLAENAQDIIYRFRIGPEAGFEYISPAVTKITGYTPEEFYDEADLVLKLVHPEDLAFPGDFVQFPTLSSKPHIMRWIHKDGRTIWTEQRNVLVYNEAGDIVAVEGIARDITERKLTEEKLKHLSLHDPLTGLFNRAYFEREMNSAEENLMEQAGIIICDVDGLKLINDTLGHDKGDLLLIEVGKVIRNSLHEIDMIARVGGDEFAVFLPNSDEGKVSKACNRIRDAIEKYNSSNPELPISVSIGFAVKSDASITITDLFKEADNNMHREKLHRSKSGRSSIVQTLKKALEVRDFITEGHAERLMDLVVAFAKEVGFPKNRMADLKLLAQFHDIGKVGIPDRILFKPGPLTSEEIAEMKRHCEIGHRIAMSAPELIPIAEFILMHHEWWNGEGYPLKLKGNEIPVECRVLAIVDAYDAMTSERPYRRAMSHAEAVEELKKCAGTQFDPALVQKFIRMLGNDIWMWL